MILTNLRREGIPGYFRVTSILKLQLTISCTFFLTILPFSLVEDILVASYCLIHIHTALVLTNVLVRM